MAVSWHMIIIIAIKTVRLRVWGWRGREREREKEREKERNEEAMMQSDSAWKRRGQGVTDADFTQVAAIERLPSACLPFMDAKRKREKWFLSPHQPAYDANWLFLSLSFSLSLSHTHILFLLSPFPPDFLYFFPLIYSLLVYFCCSFSSIDENNWCTSLLSILLSLSLSLSRSLFSSFASFPSLFSLSPLHELNLSFNFLPTISTFMNICKSDPILQLFLLSHSSFILPV